MKLDQVVFESKNYSEKEILFFVYLQQISSSAETTKYSAFFFFISSRIF